MPYANVAELPANVRAALKPEDQTAWMIAYNKRIEALEAEKPKDDASIYREAYVGAWKDVMERPSSRSFVSQISTEIVDIQNEKIPVAELMQQADAYLTEGGIGHSEHTSRPTLTMWDIQEGTDEKTGKPAIFAYGNFYRDQPMYDRAWARFVRGEEDEFSIGALVSRTSKCDKEGCYTVAHPAQLFEVSTTAKGANPQTGVLWVHVPQGEGEAEDVKTISADFTVKSVHAEEECPVKKAYLAFKERMGAFGVETSWLYGTVYLTGQKLADEDVQQDVASEFPDDYRSTVMPAEDGTLSQVVVLRDGVLPASPDDFIFLIVDELEAIDGYKAVMTAVSNSDLDDASKQYIADKLQEIVDDEVDHARIDYDILVRTNFPPQEEPVSDDAEPAEEVAQKSDCPMGQHEHAGVVGCHDIAQIHDEAKHVPGSDKLNLTDEHIDLNAILNASTPRLQSLITGIAGALQGHDDDEVTRFMATPMGKEFTLMILELRKRKLSKGDVSMSETKDVGASAPDAKPAVKSEDDPVGAQTDIASLLAALNAKIDAMGAQMKGLDAKIATIGGQSQSVESAVADAVGGLQGGKETAGAEKADEASPAVPEASHKEPDGDEGTGKPAVGVPAKEEPDGDEQKPAEKSTVTEPLAKPSEEPEKKPAAVPAEKSVDAGAAGITASAVKDDKKCDGTAGAAPVKEEEKSAEDRGAPKMPQIDTKCNGEAQKSEESEAEAKAKVADGAAEKAAPAMAESDKPKDGVKDNGPADSQAGKPIQGAKMHGPAENKPAVKTVVVGVPDGMEALKAYLCGMGLGESVTVEATGTPSSMGYEMQYHSTNPGVIITVPTESVPVVKNDLMGGNAGVTSPEDFYKSLMNGTDDAKLKQYFGGN